MKVYKGTDKEIKCRGYQFTPGVEAVEDRAELCEAGFHACEAPLDVLGYYPPGAGSRYFEAELEDVSPERHIEDTKVCGKRIKLGAEIGIPGLVKAQFEWVKSNCETTREGGVRSALTGGNDSALTGGYGSALTGGNRSALTGGNRSALTGGVRSALTGGNCSALRGGVCSKFKGGKWAVFACEILDPDTWDLIGVKTAVVDGETLKTDTWYKIENGEFVEVCEDE